MNWMAMIVVFGLGMVVTFSPPVEEQLSCPDFCSRAFMISGLEEGACSGYDALVTWDPGSQAGSCECDGETCRTKPSPQCKALGTLLIAPPTGATLWQKVRCNPGETPEKFTYYCRGPASMQDPITVRLACYGCGCHSQEVTFEGFTQACGQVNTLSQCNVPPDAPPTGPSFCSISVEVLCLNCRAGDPLCQ